MCSTSLSSLALWLCPSSARFEFVRPFVWRVTVEPNRLDHTAALRRGGLLVLAGKIVFAERAADLLEGRQWLALGMQCLAALPANEYGPNSVSRV